MNGATQNCTPKQVEFQGGLDAPLTSPLVTIDPFDPARLRLAQDFTTSVGVHKAVVAVPVRKPAKEWFVRVHPAEEYRLPTAVIELKEDRELYLVDPALWDALRSEATFGPRQLVTAVNRQGVVFLWPIRLPAPCGKIDDWNRSALEAARLAQNKWVRITANMSAGSYDVVTVSAELSPPEWPNLSFGELLKVAFKDRFIDSFEHPAVLKLKGAL